MITWFRGRGSLTGDVILAGAALVLTLLAIAGALVVGWQPSDIPGYVLVAVLSAAAWPLSQVFPRTTLLAVAMLVATPLWSFAVPELRIVPLMIASFRAAGAGASLASIVPISGVAAFLSLSRDSIWYAVDDFIVSGEFRFVSLADPSSSILLAVVLTVVIALGAIMHALRGAVEQLQLRNEQLLALQETERQRVAAEVRTEIAREVHDVVAHHVSAMVIRAQAAERVADREPDRLLTTIQAIVADGNDALTAMRGAVRMLRAGPVAAADGSGPAVSSAVSSAVTGAVTGGITVTEAITAAIDRVRVGGLEVELVGTLPDAPEFVQTAMLRIVQESLTNVMLHSDAQRVTVEFTGTDLQASVTVTDDGLTFTETAEGGGNGIPGMAERAQMLGGSLVAGRHDGGWQVRATLPRTGIGAHA